MKNRIEFFNTFQTQEVGDINEHKSFLPPPKEDQLHLNFINSDNKTNQFGILITFIKLVIVPANIPCLWFLQKPNISEESTVGHLDHCLKRWQSALPLMSNSS